MSHEESLARFRDLGHVVHIARCTKSHCPRHYEFDYFTPKDNDIASAAMRWMRASLSKSAT